VGPHNSSILHQDAGPTSPVSLRGPDVRCKSALWVGTRQPAVGLLPVCLPISMSQEGRSTQVVSREDPDVEPIQHPAAESLLASFLLVLLNKANATDRLVVPRAARVCR